MRRTLTALGDEPSDEALHAVTDRRQAGALRRRPRRTRARPARPALRRAREAHAGHPGRPSGCGRFRGAHPGVGRLRAGRGVRRRAARPARARPEGRGTRSLARRLAAARPGRAAGSSLSEVVRAAGGVVVRSSDGGKEVLSSIGRSTTTGRSRKGRSRTGETEEECAVREVEEETGLRCSLGRELRVDVLPRREEAPEERALLADGGRRRDAALRLRGRRRPLGEPSRTPKALLTYPRDLDVLAALG